MRNKRNQKKQTHRLTKYGKPVTAADIGVRTPLVYASRYPAKQAAAHLNMLYETEAYDCEHVKEGI